MNGPGDQIKHAAKRPADYLLEVFQSRRERNPSYSMSAFARDLGASVSLLSRVLSGTRPMTLKFAAQVSEALALKEPESNVLLLSVLQASSKNAKISMKVRARLERKVAEAVATNQAATYTTLEIEQFRAMANWHHLAILNLVTLDDFQSQPAQIAHRLGITTAEARSAIERMIAIGLLQEDPEGRLRRTRQSFYVKTNRSEFAVRKFHQQMIEKASQELQKTSDADFSRRLINGITFACAPEHLELIKDKIDRLQDEILALTQDGAKDSVYQMNVQFFPLTKPKKERESQ
ncbi:TIGR02147 family protein [Bdellovibrionota bacterium FG-1]